MSGSLSRRTLLTAVPTAVLPTVLPAAASAAEPAFAAFRVVRGRPGEPGTPEVTLPSGYEILPGERYSVASRAEYYTFVRGPRDAAGIEVTVRWPGERVEAVVHQDTRLELRRVPGDRHSVSFALPMTQSSPDANQPTLQIWSHPDVSPGMNWRIEHNDPDRAAGPWTTVPWPAGPVASVIHQMVAAHTILRDSGMVDVAAAKGHRFVLMGIETNNTLHPDNPPHWHISYNSGADFAAPTHNPHFWLDPDGRNFYNGMDVTGLGRLKYYVGDPAPVYDFVGDANDGRGDLVVTFTLRQDGGIDVTSPQGRAYAIAAGRNGDLVKEVTALRDGEPWLRVRTEDRVRQGVLVVRVEGLRDHADSRVRVHRYDRLTGVLLNRP
ncbi:hypothetical protein E1267_40075 [Nonomuraea longispora]|uniref:Uncharacterized protein n=1 Tax=Nonomuraea longispora TaxID=1848320 RepID=A0A4R4MQ94_9ACTN|nr:hypothetical protein [Nonomuraea longispora]TDB97243.1 hypothetical protein E1267_40075 [Nonomuraea longispora]